MIRSFSLTLCILVSSLVATMAQSETSGTLLRIDPNLGYRVSGASTQALQVDASMTPTDWVGKMVILPVALFEKAQLQMARCGVSYEFGQPNEKYVGLAIHDRQTLVCWDNRW